MSFRVASRGSGRLSSRAGFSGSGGAGSMAMSISGSSSASSVVEGGGWVGASGAEVVFGEAMVSVVVTTVRENMESQVSICLRKSRRYLDRSGAFEGFVSSC